MKEQKILLFGATGMAGHVVYNYLKSLNKYKISNIVFRKKLNPESIILDITNKQEVEKIIHSEKPDIIINCVGILIKGSQEYPDNAIYINAYFPHLLSRLSHEMGSKLIHISTDCVFSGSKGEYREMDFKDADDTYGRSKAIGEISNGKDLTIRTSIIGPELKDKGEGLFHWFMNQTGQINGFTKAFWGGVTTIELAKAIEFAIQNGITGLVHLTNGQKISKYDLLNLFKDIFSKSDVLINPVEGKSVDKSLLRSEVLLYEVPSYKLMINEMYQWMQKYKELYSY